MTWTMKLMLTIVFSFERPQGNFSLMLRKHSLRPIEDGTAFLTCLLIRAGAFFLSVYLSASTFFITLMESSLSLMRFCSTMDSIRVSLPSESHLMWTGQPTDTLLKNFLATFIPRLWSVAGLLGSISLCCNAPSFLSGSWPGLFRMIWELFLGEISGKLLLNVARICLYSSSPLKTLWRKQWSIVLCQVQKHGGSACCMISLMLEAKLQPSLASLQLMLKTWSNLFAPVEALRKLAWWWVFLWGLQFLPHQQQ